jgi:hypothetical protein
VTEAPATPVTARIALPRLANGLIAYGVLGLVLAVITALALAWATGRFASLGGRIETQAAAIADTLDRSATALQDASASATSFAVTLERTPPIVRQVGDALGEMETGLQSISSQLAQIEILGRQPLAGTADRVANMAAALDGLDTRLSLVAGDLEGNRDALLANSASLAALSEQLTSIADQLRSEGLPTTLADLRAVTLVFGMILLAWIVLPAAGALGLGWWLRRQVAPPPE